MRAFLATAVILLGAASTASAACDVKGARLEEAIADKSQLREAANKQTVRDLRTLRDAAIVLEAYKFGDECERLVEIVRKLAANPETTIERGGDTDEEKAEDMEEARKPKSVGPKSVGPKAVAPEAEPQAVAPKP